MSGIVAFAMMQRNTALLYDKRWQQQLLAFSLENLQSQSFAMQSMQQSTEPNSPYYILFQQQLAALYQLEKHIRLQQQQIQQQITVLEASSESQQKIVENWSKKAFSYFA